MESLTETELPSSPSSFRFLPRYISAPPHQVLLSPAETLVYGRQHRARREQDESVDTTVRRFVEGAVGADLDSLPGADAGAGVTGRRRDAIAKFSPASKRRLIRWLVDLAPAILAAVVLRSIAFVSLTYGRDAAGLGVSASRSKRDFDVWMKHHLAHTHPSAALVWVWEVQKRKAAHFHCVVFLDGVLAQEFAEWCADSWISVTGLGGSTEQARREHAADVRPLDDDAVVALGLVEYLVKEMTKSRNESHE